MQGTAAAISTALYGSTGSLIRIGLPFRFHLNLSGELTPVPQSPPVKQHLQILKHCKNKQNLFAKGKSGMNIYTTSNGNSSHILNFLKINYHQIILHLSPTYSNVCKVPKLLCCPKLTLPTNVMLTYLNYLYLRVFLKKKSRCERAIWGGPSRREFHT